MAGCWEADCATPQCNFSAEAGEGKGKMKSLLDFCSTFHDWQVSMYIIHSSENVAPRLSVPEMHMWE